MTLKREQMALLSRLLDEALPLDEAGRRQWLENLSPERQSLSEALRAALLSGAALGEKLSTLPKLMDGQQPQSVASGLQEGARVGPYELRRLLGCGGMAEVWLARRADGAFRREVALKLPLLTRRRKCLEQRFARERDILAKLEHPHIARLYDAGVDVEGLPYLSMEYVEGRQTLLGWCDAHRCAIPERLTLFLQVLSAVEYAHEKHVIHRDLKPSNILVTESGQVRLLDFGIARLLQDEDASDQTELSRVYGQALTPDYASPELLCGAPVDARSDVYSLGVVLHELLTGARPYRLSSGASIALLGERLAAVDVKPPSSQLAAGASVDRGTTLDQLTRQLRGDLDAIVLKALAKEPALRYGHAADMAEDLQRYLRGEPIKARSAPLLYRAGKFVTRNRATVWLAAMSVIAILIAVAADRLLPGRADRAMGATFAPPAHSVAVLAFTNLSGDPKEEYFSDGISEELINALAHVEALQVSARTSSFAFRGKELDIGTIARKLNVAAILEGSIRRSGHTVRITAQLINAVNGFHLWSQTYDRDLGDILALQTEIASAVAQEMQVKLLGREPARMEVGGTRNPEAHDAYLRGRQIEETVQDVSAARQALSLFDHAIALDPNFAAAHTHRAHALRLLADYSAEPPAVREFYAQARQAAEQAIALAPEYADAHMVLGWHILVNGYLDLGGAAAEIYRAMALAPGSAAVLDGYAGFQGILGHHDVALAAVRHAIQLDPQNPRYREHLLENLSFARRFAEVQRAVPDLEALNAGSYYAGYFSATSNLALGLPEQARRTCASPATPLPQNNRDFCLALADRALGKLAQATAELGELKALEGDLGAVDYAAVYAQWGDPATALRWLATAERVQKASLRLLKVDWMFDPLRTQPQFQALERRLNFPL